MIWLNEKDAAEIGMKDNDWCEVYNRNGVVISRAVVSPGLPRGIMFMFHAQDRHINVPMSKISGTRGGTRNTPTRIHMKPTHMRKSSGGRIGMTTWRAARTFGRILIFKKSGRRLRLSSTIFS